MSDQEDISVNKRLLEEYMREYGTSRYDYGFSKGACIGYSLGLGLGVIVGFVIAKRRP
jgi:hypothetical protein